MNTANHCRSWLASEEALSGNLAFTDATKNPEAFTVRALYQPASING
jgi:hypothetical protein